MAELVDAPDSKSGIRKDVGVRFPLPVPNIYPLASVSVLSFDETPVIIAFFVRWCPHLTVDSLGYKGVRIGVRCVLSKVVPQNAV